MVRVIIVALLALIFLTGCWDMSQIEDLGFVLGVALDQLTDEELKEFQSQYQKEVQREPKHLFKTTYQVVKPSALSENSTDSKAFFNITTVGQTNFKNNRNISSRRSRRLNYQHIKAIVISDKLVEKGKIGSLVDFFIRDHEMRRDTLFYIAKGNAAEIFADKLPLEIMPAISINKIQENFRVHHAMPKEMDMGSLIGALLEDRAFLVPRIALGGDVDLKLAGAAVFDKENEFLGWLGEWDIEGYNIIMEDVEKAVMEVPYKEDLIVFEADNHSTKIRYQFNEGKDSFHIEIRVEGFFGENWNEGEEIADIKEMEKISEAVEKQIIQLASDIIKKMQNEFHVDTFKFYREIQKKNNKRWKEVKDNWDGENGLFEKAEITLEAKVNIRHYMTKERVS